MCANTDFFSRNNFITVIKKISSLIFELSYKMLNTERTNNIFDFAFSNAFLSRNRNERGNEAGEIVFHSKEEEYPAENSPAWRKENGLSRVLFFRETKAAEVSQRKAGERAEHTCPEL